VPHRRTWREAIVQADAKESLRSAIAIRGAGAGATLGGIFLLLRTRTWSGTDSGIRVEIGGLPSFSLPLLAIVGICLIPAGLMIYLIGQRILTRRIERISANPTTAVVLDAPVDPE
jgi:hypothetical protein